MTREYKTFVFQLKASDDKQGIITGYLSVFNNVDQGMDRVLKGAFKRTLANSKKRAKDANNPYIFPMLWQHDLAQPIGGVTEAVEDDYGLLTTAQFDLDTQKGREAYSGYKKGYLNQLSIGYDVIKKSYDEKGVRNLEELRLWEQSTVTFGMNEDALVTGVKANNTMPSINKQHKDFNANYQKEQIQDWMWMDFNNLTSALEDSIMDLFKIGDTPQADLIDTILDDGNGQGFISALKAYVQKGIDLDVSDYLSELQQSSPYSSYMSAADTHQLKAGGMSRGKKDTIQAHVDDLHATADTHLATAKKHSKALHTAADDLATVLQGSEAAYGTDHGTPEKSSPRSSAPGQKDHSSSVDTDLDEAYVMLQLTKLKSNSK